MSLRPSEGWEKAAKLIKLCLGFSQEQDHRLYKTDQKYNNDSGYHVITLTLEVKQNLLVKGVNKYVAEVLDHEFKLLKEINDGMDI